MSGRPEPYFADDLVTLYLGDSVELMPALGVKADCIVADPPYGETTLPWDQWPAGWLYAAADVTCSLWCFGSLRMFLAHADEFSSWRLSQDIIWEKHNGSSRAADRFKRIHEVAAHWYRGRWSEVYHETPRVAVAYRTASAAGSSQPSHTGTYASAAWVDDGTRLTPSILRVRSMQHGTAIHRTQKPVGIVSPLIEYACPPGGLVIDPFAGSCTTLVAARDLGRRSIGIESSEAEAEKGARRLAQGTLDFGGAA